MKPAGIISAMITPFSRDGAQVDEVTLRQLVDSGVSSGLGGVVPCGGTGEFTTLSTEERQRVVEVVVDQAKGRLSVVAQVGATSTREACALAMHAEATGADAIMLATPYYEPIGFDAVRRYFRDVASVTRLPICIYNYPAAMKLRYDQAMVATLMQDNPSIAFIKDSGGDLGFLNALKVGSPRIDFFAGDDMLVFPSFVLGCTGALTGTANFIAPALGGMLKAANDADLPRLRMVWEQVSPLVDAVCSGHFNSGVKAACAALGFSVGPLRAPYDEPQVERDHAIARLVRQTEPALMNTKPEPL